MRHQRFDSSKGYPGEGPGTVEEQLHEDMQRALDDAAIAAAGEDAGRPLQEPYCVRTVGVSPDKAKELAVRMRELCMELELEVDCTGMTAARAAWA